MREAIFNTEIANSLRAAGAFAYKIADSPTSWTQQMTRFTPEKPCDIIGIYKGRGFLIECKQMKKFEAFAPSRMRTSQISSFDQMPNSAFVFLNIRIKAVKGESKHENRLIIFPWPMLKARWVDGSIKAKDLVTMSYIKGKEGEFELGHFLNEVAGG